MAQLTYQQYAQKLESKIRQLKANKPLEIAARDTIGMVGQRIFIKGLDIAETQIGTYSRKPIYINPDQAPRKVRNVGKRGTAIKSGYYEGGYYEFRGQQGRENSFVNLRLTNELQNDLLNFNLNKASTAFGNINIESFKAGENVYEMAFKKSVNSQKRRGLEKKYGAIFGLSKNEKQNFLKVIDFEINKILQN